MNKDGDSSDIETKIFMQNDLSIEFNIGDKIYIN